MTAKEAAELFRDEMMNEIYNSSADELAKEELIESVKTVAKTVIETINAR